MPVVVYSIALRFRCNCFQYCMSIKSMSGLNGRSKAVVKTTSKHWGPYHSHRKTEDFGPKIKWYASFRLESGRKYGL